MEHKGNNKEVIKMNPAGHVFLTYIATSIVVEDARKYLLLTALFAIVVDLDHMPGLFTYWKQGKRDYKTQVAHFRSFLQEPIGVVLELWAIMLLWLLGLNKTVLTIAAIGFFMHWLIDFVMVHTRPFYPFSNKMVCFFFRARKAKIISEAVVTVISGAVFLYLLF